MVPTILAILRSLVASSIRTPERLKSPEGIPSGTVWFYTTLLAGVQWDMQARCAAAASAVRGAPRVDERPAENRVSATPA